MDAAIRKWLSMDRDELDDIYLQSPAGEIPRGDTRGTAIVAGSSRAQAFAKFARMFAWQGKIFDIFPPTFERGILINKVTPFSASFIVAKVYKDKSWMDDKETIVIDYSSTSFVAQKSEMRYGKLNPVSTLARSGGGKSVSSILHLVAINRHVIWLILVPKFN